MSFATSDFRATWRRTVERHPDRPAVETLATGARISYAELHRQAASVAQDLRAAGVRSGHLVGLRTANRHRFCLGLLSAWLADAVAVPLSASAPDVYVRELVDRAGAAITLVDDDGPSGLRPAGPLGADPSAHVGLAYVMHTSGSTGRSRSPSPTGHWAPTSRPSRPQPSWLRGTGSSSSPRSRSTWCSRSCCRSGASAALRC